MYKYIVLFILMLSVSAEAQRIESIQLYNPNRDDSNPVMSMDEKLILSFDVLEANYSRYSYKITRYNALWKPSKAFASEYIAGYTKNVIRDYQKSFNTRQIYNHYKLEFPNNDFKFLLSGNYQIEIFKNNKSLFKRKFIVYENKTNIGLAVDRTPSNDYRNQKITITAQSNQFDFTQGEALSLFIYKNNNLKDGLTLNRATFTQPHQLKFIDDKLRFSGGVEYQFFDTKDLNIAGMTTQKIIKDSLYQAVLYPISYSPELPYIEKPDINGDFIPRVLIGRKDYPESNQADYVRVHFALKASSLPIDSKVCIYGMFNDFTCSKDDFLTYDDMNDLWVTNKLLKQGFYNYSVALYKDHQLYPEEITGSYWETENEFAAILYFKPWGTRYDLAIGLGEGFSRESQR